MTKASLIYKRIWEQAYEKGQITLKFDSAIEVRRMRLNLYAGVQKWRKDTNLDREFSNKLDELELVVEGLSISIHHKDKNPLLRKAAQQLDGLLDEPPTS